LPDEWQDFRSCDGMNLVRATVDVDQGHFPRRTEVFSRAPSKEEAMLRLCRVDLSSLVLTCALLVPTTQASAFELSGAWASQGDLCNLVFIKKGSEVAFAELSDLYGSGFIIDSGRIRGKAARCTIESRKQDGNNLTISAACATSIMTQDMKFNVKILDDDNLSREFEEIPGMSVKYSRCKL
jgi:hypothetical protein